MHFKTEFGSSELFIFLYEIYVKFIFTDKPSPPQNLTAPEVLADSITLCWESPADNGGRDVTGYVIERREMKKQSWRKVTEVEDLKCSIGQLLEGNQYFFRVFAQNEIGMSEPVEMTEPITAKNPFSEYINLNRLCLDCLLLISSPDLKGDVSFCYH